MKATQVSPRASGLGLFRPALAGLLLASLIAASCGGGSDSAKPAGTTAKTALSATKGTDSLESTKDGSTAGTAATTTTPVEVKLTIGKKVWFKGFEIAIDDGVFTPDPRSKAPKRGGELALSGTATNLTNGSLNFGYIGQQSPLSIVTKGDTFTLETGTKDVPEGGKAKVTIKGTLGDFDQADAVVIFGATGVNGAKLPLGGAAVTTFAPKKVTLTGTASTPSGLGVTLLSAEITPFSLDAGGGGATQQAKAGELYLKLSGRENYSGTVNNAIFNPALVRPDGLTAGADGDDGYGVIDPGQQKDGFHVFTIPATVAGNYVFRFSGSSSADKAEVPFTLS